MALFASNSGKKKRDQMLAIDLGSRTTKAVHLQRRGNDFVLCGYTVMDAPIFEKTLSVDLLSEHLKAVSLALGAKTKTVSMAIGMSDSLIRHVEMPRIPVDDMRQALKFNSKGYLQQDLTGHVFDCYIVPQQNAQPKTGPGAQKQKVIVAGAKKQLTDDFLEATKSAGLMADQLVPALVCPSNTFEIAMPEAFSREVVALVDIGFKSSFICIVQEGELVLSRVVTLGGDRLTAGLAESLNTSYAEAEGIKIGMAHEVQTQLEALMSPLGRELRASIDFFEHQHDKPVSRAFVTGGSAKSEFILQALQNDLMIECKTWNPTDSLQKSLSAQQEAELSEIAPQLTIALGAAFSAL
jgi:type IV pilus assembly protein PilM